MIDLEKVNEDDENEDAIDYYSDFENDFDKDNDYESESEIEEDWPVRNNLKHYLNVKSTILTNEKIFFFFAEDNNNDNSYNC